MRIGAVMADDLTPMVGMKKDKMVILDQSPGRIGDAAEEHERVGRLGLGAPRAVNKQSRYESYEVDKEPLSANERQIQRTSRGEELG
jgi:hypothetical protein